MPRSFSYPALLAASGALFASLMLFGRLFGAPAATRLDLDGLAVLEVPASFHRDDSRELKLPAARRLRRRPYREAVVLPDQLTYYLLSHDRQGFGGREVPVLLRVTLYAPDAPLALAPDAAYFSAIAQQNFHHDGQKEAIYTQVAPAPGGFYYTEERSTEAGWLSVQERRLMHLILTDTVHHARLFLSVTDREMTRPAAEQLLRRAQQSLVTQPMLLAQHFEYVRHFLQHAEAIRQANQQVNLAAFNQQLTRAGLPTLQAAELYRLGRFVDTGLYFYGANGEQQLYFGARLGYSTRSRPDTPPYFAVNNPDGRYLPYVNQQAVLQWPAPAAHELRLRGAVSEPLWYPPEELASFSVAELLAEAAATVTQAQRQPDYLPPVAATPARWELPYTYTDEQAAPGARLDYRRACLRVGYPADPVPFQLRYLGQRQVGTAPPQLVFTLEVFDGSPRYRDVAADARYLTIDAAQGGELPLEVAGTRYLARVEPLATGHLTLQRQ